MSTTELTLKESRETTLHAYNAVMEVLEDDVFMDGVLKGLAAEQSGQRGKTLEEIRKEHGLTH
ncbi:MAG: hypothetical protein HY873_13185 [Chloroflexi bacterium]|nr:hypothetical protein [Chloroflexota bacterium]